VLDILAMNPV